MLWPPSPPRSRRLSRRPRREARARRRTQDGRPRAGAGSPRAHGREPRRLHPDVPGLARRGRRPRKRRRRCATCSSTRPPSTPGPRRWRARLRGGARQRRGGAPRRAMRAVNPAFIPRNHRVEAMIEAAVEATTSRPSRSCWRCWPQPYDDQPAFARYRRAAAGRRSASTGPSAGPEALASAASRRANASSRNAFSCAMCFDITPGPSRPRPGGPRSAAASTSVRLAQHPFEIGLDEAPGAHVLGLFLAPDDIGVLEARELVDERLQRERIKLLDAQKVDVVDAALLALLVKVVIDLAGAQHDAADLVVLRRA